MFDELVLPKTEDPPKTDVVVVAVLNVLVVVTNEIEVVAANGEVILVCPNAVVLLVLNGELLVFETVVVVEVDK